VDALTRQAQSGYHHGAFSELELRLAEKIVRMVPSAEAVKFANSGTEANMYAIRLARTITKRIKIAKFEGGWHGGYDALHVAVRPPLEEAQSGGLSEGSTKDTIALPYNDLDRTRKKLRAELPACVIVEPVTLLSGVVPAEREFLKGLREVCDEVDSLLVFDEIVTGFRLRKGGGQEYYGVMPDITTLGKVLGGGLPTGAIAGRTDILAHTDREKYSGLDLSFVGGTGICNAMSMTAGIATLEEIEKGEVHPKIDKLGDMARRKLAEAFSEHRVPFVITGVGSMFGCHFTNHPVTDARSANAADRTRAVDFQKHLLEHGIFMIVTQTMHGCVSYSHTDEDIEQLATVAREFASALK
jgi:glutamate-1-semialdehyde 2,1-aminomutase